MTATRLLPGRILGPRILAPRIRGAESAAVVQTATHLVLTMQPGGAVSGVPLTIQPVGQALDALDALVTDFGGTITAVVSSGAATISAGGSVVASGGGFAFAGLTLTGPAGLVTITLQSDPLTPITSVAFMLEAAPVPGIVLVDAPTRVDRPRRIGAVGDTLIFMTTLRGADGSPQDLAGAQSVTFTLDKPDGSSLVIAQAATVLQTGSGDTAVNKGMVTYTVKPSVGVPEGEGRWKYRAKWDVDTVLSFPDDNSATITMYPDLDEP